MQIVKTKWNLVEREAMYENESNKDEYAGSIRIAYYMSDLRNLHNAKRIFMISTLIWINVAINQYVSFYWTVLNLALIKLYKTKSKEERPGSRSNEIGANVMKPPGWLKQYNFQETIQG